MACGLDVKYFFTTKTFAYLIGNVSFFPTTFREYVHAQVILPLRIGDNVPRHSIRYRILMTAIYFSVSCVLLPSNFKKA